MLYIEGIKVWMFRIFILYKNISDFSIEFTLDLLNDRYGGCSYRNLQECMLKVDFKVLNQQVIR